jgi:hypothetical protein
VVWSLEEASPASDATFSSPLQAPKSTIAMIPMPTIVQTYRFDVVADRIVAVR